MDQWEDSLLVDKREREVSETAKYALQDRMLERCWNALQHLFEASALAHHLGRGIWDFAVEIGALRKCGLDDNDLRWLVSGGWVECGRETHDAEIARRFTHPNALTFTRRTCVVLTPRGARIFGDARGQFAPVAPDAVRPASLVERTSLQQPVWDTRRRELRLGLAVVKQFKLPAVNQETILIVFEEEGWPPQIDDPLSPRPNLEPKRRLHDTINSLNRNQKRPLLRFSGDGSGKGVRWQLADDGRAEARVSERESASGTARFQKDE